MNPCTIIARHARVHGITWRWLGLVIATWVGVGTLAPLGLPPVDPHLEVEQRPLESLATLALVAPALVHALPLRSEVGWLGAVSPRRMRLGRAAWAVAHGLVGGAAAAVCWWAVLPAGVPLRHVMALWTALWALTATLLALALPRAAAVLPLALVAVNSSAALVPWRVDAVYNLSLDRPLIAVAALLTAVAIGAMAWAPRRRWSAGRM